MTPVTPSSVCDMQGEREQFFKAYLQADPSAMHVEIDHAWDGMSGSMWQARAALAERTQQEAQPSGSDKDFWIKSRASILLAIEKSGFRLMSNKDGFWLDRPTSAANSTAQTDAHDFALDHADCTAPMQPSEAMDAEARGILDRLEYQTKRADMWMEKHDALEKALAAPTQAAGGEAASDAASWAKEWGMMVQSVDALTGAQRTAYQFTSERFGHMMDAFERHVRAAAPAAAVEPRTTPPCRDCADFGPICPSSGQPCDKRAAAVPLSSMPDLQAAVAKGLADGSLVPQGAAAAPEGLTGWNLLTPEGNIAATEATCVRAWARINGYKPTVEGLLGYEEQGWRVVPATPDAKTAEARKPLTAVEIRNWWASDNGLEDCEMCKLDDFTSVVRAVERKHGIGDQP